jgi:uncharacterized protein YdiU (UPF0061 family)
LFSSQNDLETLKKISDFTIKHYFPEITSTGKEKYLDFFKSVSNKTLEMVVHWQRVGFVHGVMNTDNMSILGLTIDYGPYGWLEDYNYNWTPNTTDREFKRYRFENQPNVAQWNLYQLANALYPLIEEAQPLELILGDFQQMYHSKYLDMMRAKLGLKKIVPEDEKLIASLEKVLQLSETDMTIFFREISWVKKNSSSEICIATINNAFYKPEEIEGEILKSWYSWFDKYTIRLQLEELSDKERKINMNRVNPKYVLRNYMAQLAIDAAEMEDYSILIELQELLKNSYEEQLEFSKWYAKRPDWARDKIGCSMLSCSS